MSATKCSSTPLDSHLRPFVQSSSSVSTPSSRYLSYPPNPSSLTSLLRQAPFRTAFLQSNAVLTNPPPPNASHTSQFNLLCTRVGLSPTTTSPADLLAQLRDPSIIPTAKIMRAVEGMDEHSYFRGVQDVDGFVQEVEGYQQGTEFAEDLRKVGVQCVVLGGVRDEVRLLLCFPGLGRRCWTLTSASFFLRSSVAEPLLPDHALAQIEG